MKKEREFPTQAMLEATERLKNRTAEEIENDHREFRERYASWARAEANMWRCDEKNKGKKPAGFGEDLYCPVCGQTLFEEWSDFDRCEICGWYNDGIQYNDHDYEGGCNHKSVNQLKALWKEGRINTERNDEMKLEYLGKPFTGHVLNVYVYDDEKSKLKAMQTIERFKWLISTNAFAALIYVFEDGDVLQYCGGKDFFELEYIKMVGETPNIRHLNLCSRKELTGRYGHYYGNDYSESMECDVIPADLLTEIIKYTLNGDRSNWLEFLNTVCSKYHMYMESYTMTSRGITRIRVKE